MANLDVLWEYQALDVERDRLEREARSTPTRAKLNKLHGFLTEQQGAIAQLQKEMEARQSALARLDERVDQLQKKAELEDSELEQMLRDEEVTAAEFTECRESYEKLQSEAAALRRELSELTKWLEQAAKDYRETRSRAGKAKKEYDALKLCCEQELAAAAGPLKDAAAAAEAKAKQVDPPLLAAYKRVKKNHAIPMAKVEHNQCGGCNMSLPTVVIKRVANKVSVVECENCGRILYTAD